MAVVGFGGDLEPAVEALCRALGREAIDAGFRLATGGLGGVMAAASRGGHESEHHRDGDIFGILPSYQAATANPWVDVVVATGMGIARNVVLVASADVVVAVGGGSGTLSEIAIAWQLGKPIVALDVDGWSHKLADTSLDGRRPDRIARATTAAEAVAIARTLTAP